MLQLHGKETPERVVAVRSRFRLPVMKALPIETRADLAPIRLYEKVADWLLFDARAPREATRPGGLGKTFDWTPAGKSRSRKFRSCCRAGSMPDNVAEALRITRAPAVDVSSGVERAPGEKDPEKIRAFIRAARVADNALPQNSRARHDRRAAAQFVSHRARRARAFRHLWRPLRRRDADAAHPGAGEGLRRGQGRSGVQARDGRPSQELCRPAVAALFRRAADRAFWRRARSISSARTSTTPARTR